MNKNKAKKQDMQTFYGKLLKINHKKSRHKAFSLQNEFILILYFNAQETQCQEIVPFRQKYVRKNGLTLDERACTIKIPHMLADY